MRPIDSTVNDAPGDTRTALVVMGVAGSGKTTIADVLGRRLDWPVAEGDDFHSAVNRAKMSAGVALSDDDRAPWLLALRDWIDRAPTSVIITCSALRREYRGVLRTAAADVRFLHLHGSEAVLRNRIRDRRGHFMPPALLASQLSTLEPLQDWENGLMIEIDGSPQQIADRAVRLLGPDTGSAPRFR